MVHQSWVRSLMTQMAQMCVFNVAIVLGNMYFCEGSIFKNVYFLNSAFNWTHYAHFQPFLGHCGFTTVVGFNLDAVYVYSRRETL